MTLPEWLNKDTVAVVGFIWTVFLGPLLVLYLGKIFAKREAVEAVNQAVKDYVKAHAEEHEEIEERLNRGETRFITLEASIREVKSAAEDARDAAEKAQAAADKVNHALLEVEKVRGDFKELRALVGPLRDIVQAAVTKIGG